MCISHVSPFFSDIRHQKNDICCGCEGSSADNISKHDDLIIFTDNREKLSYIVCELVSAHAVLEAGGKNILSVFAAEHSDRRVETGSKFTVTDQYYVFQTAYPPFFLHPLRAEY